MSERAFPGTRVAANGLTFHVVDQGSGPAILLMHGFPDDADLWRHQIPVLVDAGYRVVAPDLRGFGDTDKPDGIDAFGIFNSVADMRALLDTRGIERASVIGHDMGAGVGWLLAIADPGRVERYIAVSVGHPGAFTRATFSQMKASWYTFFFQFEGVAETLLVKDDWALMRAWLASHPDADNRIAALQRSGALTAGLGWYRANVRPEVWGLDIDYPKITIPTMGIWSSADFALNEEQMSESEEFVAGPWRYERIDGAGHWVQLEKPEIVNALLLDFLKS